MIILTDEELEQVTNRSRKSSQIEVLRRLGIPFLLHPVDKKPVVLRSALEACLGYSPTSSSSRGRPSIRIPKAMKQ